MHTKHFNIMTEVNKYHSERKLRKSLSSVNRCPRFKVFQNWRSSGGADIMKLANLIVSWALILCFHLLSVFPPVSLIFFLRFLFSLLLLSKSCKRTSVWTIIISRCVFFRISLMAREREMEIIIIHLVIYTYLRYI